MNDCLLCSSIKIIERTNHFNCTNCYSIFKDPSTFLSYEDEKGRYLMHKNDVNDADYQNFVSPIIKEVIANFPPKSRGLDFGAGTGPVIAHILSKQKYKLILYDPFFHPDTAALNVTYDFIVCCEVMEHFHQPKKEFKLLSGLLKPNGKLIAMTELIPKTINYDDWYYKDDPTHVFFYSKESINWIKEHMGFNQCEIKDRLVVFTK